MKRIFKLLSLLIITSIVFVFISCNDEENYPSEGYFKIGDYVYSVNEATLEDVGYEEWTKLYQMRLKMVNTTHSEPRSINVLFYTDVNTYLPSAEYTPYLMDENYKDKFKRGAWEIDGEEGGVFLSGKIKSSKSNDIYKITIDCKDINGISVTGVYDGEIRVIE